MPLHPFANFFLGKAVIVRWRVDWLRSLNLDHHDLLDSMLRTSFPVEGEHVVIDGT
jgi:hypothetical protein